MNQELKTKWVEALRSGTYTQGRGALRSNDGHCCLGVLCDIMNPNLWDEWNYFDGQIGSLSDNFVSRIGMPPTVGGINTQKLLVTMNDGELKNFNEIADWIEENL